jgi:hypothetical protein
VLTQGNSLQPPFNFSNRVNVKTQLLATVLAINSILAIAGSVFAAPADSPADDNVDTAALSRAIAKSIEFEEDGISLVHVAIDRALMAKQMAGGGVDNILPSIVVVNGGSSRMSGGGVKNTPPPILVTAGMPKLPQPNQDKP